MLDITNNNDKGQTTATAQAVAVAQPSNQPTATRSRSRLSDKDLLALYSKPAEQGGIATRRKLCKVEFVGVGEIDRQLIGAKFCREFKRLFQPIENACKFTYRDGVFSFEGLAKLDARDTLHACARRARDAYGSAISVFNEKTDGQKISFSFKKF